MTQLYTNNANTTLSVALTAAATSLVVQPGAGAKFPAPAAGDSFLLTLFKVAGGVESGYEIVKVTARASDTFTIVRAQEGTVAQAYGVGDQVSHRITAGTMAGLAQLGAPVAFTSTVAVPNVTAGDNTTNAANTAFVTAAVNTAVSNLVASSPATLNTLKELADAINDDPSFSATMTTALGNRLRVDVNTQGLTTTQQSNARTNLGLATVAATGSYTDLINKPSIAAPGVNADITSMTALTNISNGGVLGIAMTPTAGNSKVQINGGAYAIVGAGKDAPDLNKGFWTGPDNSATYNGFGWQLNAANGASLLVGNGSNAWTERLRVDNAGNLGVGTASPASYGKLAVLGTIAAVSPDGVTQSVTWAANTGEVRYGGYNQTGTNFLTFTAGGAAERMRIDATGNLLVGATASSGSAYRMEVDGAADNRIGLRQQGVLTGMLQATPNTFTVGAVGASSVVTLNTNGAERMRIDATGKLGIGTTAPDQKLTIASGSDATNAGDGISFYGSSTNKQAAILSYNSGNFNGDLRFYTKSSSTASTAATEQMRLDAFGNLGLGVVQQSWHSSSRAIQLNTTGVIEGYSGAALNLGHNMYRNSSGTWTYLTTGVASMCSMYNGGMAVYTAASGNAGTAVTLVQAMTLLGNGNLLLNSTVDDGVGKLQVNGNITTTGTLVAKGTSLLGGATGAYSGMASAVTMNYTGVGTQYGMTIKPASSTGDSYAFVFLPSTATYAGPNTALATITHMSGDAGMNLGGAWKYQGNNIVHWGQANVAGGFAALSGYNLQLKNAAGAAQSQIASAATAARTWTLPDKDGTVAMMDDVANAGVSLAQLHAAALCF